MSGNKKEFNVLIPFEMLNHISIITNTAITTEWLLNVIKEILIDLGVNICSPPNNLNQYSVDRIASAIIYNNDTVYKAVNNFLNNLDHSSLKIKITPRKYKPKNDCIKINKVNVIDYIINIEGKEFHNDKQKRL